MKKLKNLIKVLDSLSSFTRLYFVWKISERKWLPLLPHHQRYHDCKYCELVKNSSQAAFLRCSRHHAEAAFLQATQKRQPFLLDCHAGIRELVVPVLAGNCRAAIFAGPLLSAGGGGKIQQQYMKEYLALPKFSNGNIPDLSEFLTTLIASFEPESWPRESLSLLPLIDFAKTDPRICSVLRILHRDFRVPLHQNTLARNISLSPSRLCHLFRRNIGMSLQEYLQRIRVAEAHQLVEMTALSIGEIAHECGLSDASRLAVLFQRYYGHSPKTIRQHPLIP
ncbi:MAG: helix-turn-helix domain-containing protein [Lentisphaeria bacterium]|nr:helix-turn-helix domain-containing protein [Lentisphaeria bacterium]